MSLVCKFPLGLTAFMNRDCLVDLIFSLRGLSSDYDFYEDVTIVTTASDIPFNDAPVLMIDVNRTWPKTEGAKVPCSPIVRLEIIVIPDSEVLGENYKSYREFSSDGALRVDMRHTREQIGNESIRLLHMYDTGDKKLRMFDKLDIEWVDDAFFAG